MTITYQKFDYNGETRSIVRKKDGNFDVSIPVQTPNKDGEVFNTDYADPAINELSTIKIDTNGVITQSDGTNTAALFLTGISFHAGQIISSQGHGGGGGAPIEGKEDTGGGVG